MNLVRLFNLRPHTLGVGFCFFKLVPVLVDIVL